MYICCKIIFETCCIKTDALHPHKSTAKKPHIIVVGWSHLSISSTSINQKLGSPFTSEDSLKSIHNIQSIARVNKAYSSNNEYKKYFCFHQYHKFISNYELSALTWCSIVCILVVSGWQLGHNARGLPSVRSDGQECGGDSSVPCILAKSRVRTNCSANEIGPNRKRS